MSLREPLIVANSVAKIYRRGREEIRALDNVSLSIACGEFVAITGPSGSGKTTLLNILGCMDTPTSGTLRISGREAGKLSEREQTLLRRREIGFVFQHFGLIPTLTVAENVALPALFARKQNSGRISELLERVGLAGRRNHRPHELSGGEMQRVAIARAVVNNPALILADEPTGNLDSETGDSIIDLFRQLNAQGLTIIVVTHNETMAAAAQRRLALWDGRLVDPSRFSPRTPPQAEDSSCSK
jgi:putative ABC transport system ATP-binding protein